MTEYIDKMQAMNIIASGKDGKAYFGTADKDWEVMDFLKAVHPANVIPIPDNATNGEVIKAMFPNIDASVSGDGDVIDVYNLGIYCQTFDTEWWNSPYKTESEE